MLDGHDHGTGGGVGAGAGGTPAQGPARLPTRLEGGQGAAGPGPLTGLLPEHETRSERERWLLCVDCGHRVTRPALRTERDGKHLHTQMNPHGVLHRVACYSDAPGCLRLSEAELYWSWFTGYSWAIVGCGGCGQHLGWLFDGPGDRFYGLLAERLVEESHPRPDA